MILNLNGFRHWLIAYFLVINLIGSSSVPTRINHSVPSLLGFPPEVLLVNHQAGQT
jgi:hypothetical protein